MARKTIADLKTDKPVRASHPPGEDERWAKIINPPKATKRARERSWACAGIDTSMSSIAMVSMVYDAVLDKMRGPFHVVTRWTGDVDYFERLRQAAFAHDMMASIRYPEFVPIENTFIAIEEPFYYGAVKRGQSGWIKQQAEISGATKASLLRWGYVNMYEINNQQWYKTVRDDGTVLRKGAEGKWDVKSWAIQAFGLPELPDLVSAKGGGKIPRPESGYGAKAKAVQPDDVYDAAGICAWMMDFTQTAGLLPSG